MVSYSLICRCDTNETQKKDLVSEMQQVFSDITFDCQSSSNEKLSKMEPFDFDFKKDLSQNSQSIDFEK